MKKLMTAGIMSMTLIAAGPALAIVQGGCTEAGRDFGRKLATADCRYDDNKDKCLVDKA